MWPAALDGITASIECRMYTKHVQDTAYASIRQSNFLSWCRTPTRQQVGARLPPRSPLHLSRHPRVFGRSARVHGALPDRHRQAGGGGRHHRPSPGQGRARPLRRRSDADKPPLLGAVHGAGLSNPFWLTDEQMRRLRPFFPKSHCKPRVDDRRVLSGIIFLNRNGLRWCDAAREYVPPKTLCNRWKRCRTRIT